MVALGDFQNNEHLAKINILLYDIEPSDNGIVGGLAQWSLQNFSSTASLLRYNNHICSVTDVKTFIRASGCPTSDKYVRRIGNLQKYIPICQKVVYPKTVYKVRETLFDKFKAFDAEIAEDNTLLKNFPSLISNQFVESFSLIDRETITWFGKHEPISVSLTSNLLQEPIFICDK